MQKWFIGCPIHYYVIEYKEETQPTWRIVSNNIRSEEESIIIRLVIMMRDEMMSIISNNISISIIIQPHQIKYHHHFLPDLIEIWLKFLHHPNINCQQKIIQNLPSDLKPGTWYSLQLTAHNGAGSRVVTTQFATLSITGDYFGDGDDSDSDSLYHQGTAVSVFNWKYVSQVKLCYRALEAPLAPDWTRCNQDWKSKHNKWSDQWSLTIDFLTTTHPQVDGSIALPIISAIIVTSTLLLVGVYVFRKRRCWQSTLILNSAKPKVTTCPPGISAWAGTRATRRAARSTRSSRWLRGRGATTPPTSRARRVAMRQWGLHCTVPTLWADLARPGPAPRTAASLTRTRRCRTPRTGDQRQTFNPPSHPLPPPTTSRPTTSRPSAGTSASPRPSPSPPCRGRTCWCHRRQRAVGVRQPAQQASWSRVGRATGWTCRSRASRRSSSRSPWPPGSPSARRGWLRPGGSIQLSLSKNKMPNLLSWSEVFLTGFLCRRTYSSVESSLRTAVSPLILPFLAQEGGYHLFWEDDDSILTNFSIHHNMSQSYRRNIFHQYGDKGVLWK